LCPRYDPLVGRDFSVIGRALAAPARSTFVNMLMDGSSRPASELAAAARVNASTASEHLSVLMSAGLITCTARGRQRFYQLADASVATAFEQLGHLCPTTPTVGLRQSVQALSLVAARLCYDHLAGRLGVAVTESMVDGGWLDQASFAPTTRGAGRLSALGIDLDQLRAGRRALVRRCSDWTERKPHLAGALGASLATQFLERGWLTRKASSRGLIVTPGGYRALTDVWNINAEELAA
jgi:DNA-binding transcriptional ArsR family regulator